MVAKSVPDLQGLDQSVAAPQEVWSGQQLSIDWTGALTTSGGLNFRADPAM